MHLNGFKNVVCNVTATLSGPQCGTTYVHWVHSVHGDYCVCFMSLFCFASIRIALAMRFYWRFVRGIHRGPVDSPHKGPVIDRWSGYRFYRHCGRRSHSREYGGGLLLPGYRSRDQLDSSRMWMLCRLLWRREVIPQREGKIPFRHKSQQNALFKTFSEIFCDGLNFRNILWWPSHLLTVLQTHIAC